MVAETVNWSLRRARDPTTKPTKLHELSFSRDPEIRLAVASNLRTSTRTLREMIVLEDPNTENHVAIDIKLDSKGRPYSTDNVLEKDARVLNAAKENLERRLAGMADHSTQMNTLQTVLRDDSDK